jgi:hypothetical protein
MKTTIDIASSILQTAKQLAEQEDRTLRDLVEEGLERVIKERAGRRAPEIIPVTYRGEGLSREFREAGWSRIFEAAYQGRGA